MGRPASPLPTGGAGRGAPSGTSMAASWGLPLRRRCCLRKARARRLCWLRRQRHRASQACAASGIPSRGGCRRGRTSRGARGWPASPRLRGPVASERARAPAAAPCPWCWAADGAAGRASAAATANSPTRADRGGGARCLAPLFHREAIVVGGWRSAVGGAVCGTVGRRGHQATCTWGNSTAHPTRQLVHCPTVVAADCGPPGFPILDPVTGYRP